MYKSILTLHTQTQDVHAPCLWSPTGTITPSVTSEEGNSLSWSDFVSHMQKHYEVKSVSICLVSDPSIKSAVDMTKEQPTQSPEVIARFDEMVTKTSAQKKLKIK